MLHHIRENIDPKITHSLDVTPAGKGFAKADGFKPKLYDGRPSKFVMSPVRDDSMEWPDAAVGNGMRWDDTFWRGKSKDRFAARVAMPRADDYQGIPEGYDYEAGDGYATLTPEGSNSWASRLLWYPSGEVKKIDTLDEHQHKGLATYLYNETLKHVPHLHHSEDLTDEGRGWANSMYDWNPDPAERADSLGDIEAMDDEGEGYEPSDDDLARADEFSRQENERQTAHWLNFINTQRRAQGLEEFDILPDEMREALGLGKAGQRVAMPG